jgi:general secretion pathway protein H
VGSVASRARNRIPSAARGFTLVELLVILVIIGISLGVVVLQLMPDNHSRLREESARLALLLENAGMEARASGRPLAWSAENNVYRFWKKNDYGDWVHLDDDPMFRARTLPEGLSITGVSVEEQALKPGEPMSLNAASFALPFRVRLIAGEYGANVNGSSTGVVSASMDSEK